MRHFCFIIGLLLGLVSTAQTQEQLSLNEYLGFVKQYHPVAKLADLNLTAAQAKLLKSRGAFDPKVEVDWKTKNFDSKEYYDILNSTFKIPTWFGVELKAGFEQNEGEFLNPQNNVPDDGLYAAGVSVPIGQGLFINKRMAELKQAKILQNLTQAEIELQVNQLLYDAVNTYFNWYLAYQEVKVFEEFKTNAKVRFDGIKSRALAGDIPTIDTLEAKIIVQNRDLSLEQANLDYTKASLELANFLWFEDNLPLELAPNVTPEQLDNLAIDDVLGTNLLQLESFEIENHPKLQALNLKIDQLEVNKRLKAEMLKPQLDLNYNFITQPVNELQGFNTNDYKAGIYFKLPLFLRKERGDLKLAKVKLNQAELDLNYQRLQLRNKINATQQAINSYNKQLETYQTIVSNYGQLLSAEERKFSFGESSVFLINSRENKLIDAQLKQISAVGKLLKTKSKLFNVLVNEINLD
ncbi:Outer membrane protein TolC [Psychroflexus salarius]|uniref:Outer membrane protein TolC n=1 Tax=Psychroflexus salarius TaxID=1155689 RepID=A0A1M4XIZ5_9FLAO|nr:TolC family protein [Psychroflexus salarius]SHE93524.1 Outer membrane protein TolC [Psychroflexus salarius]